MALSLVVVIIVTAGVFFYVRASRGARRKWLEQLDLPGVWHWRDGDARLSLGGGLDRGQFELREGEGVWRGEWSLTGHTIYLQGHSRSESMDLHMFQRGSIGLEDSSGVRRVFSKEAGNVVALRPGKGSEQDELH